MPRRRSMSATGWAVGAAAAVLLAGTAVADGSRGHDAAGSRPGEATADESGGAHPEKTLQMVTRTEGDEADAPNGEAADAGSGDAGRAEPIPEPR
jgi:hypothetical protein